MSNIPVEKNVFSKDFSKVIDVNFHQLLNNGENDIKVVSISEFFQLYEELFYQIPKEGDAESHRYILNRTAEYLGVKLSNDVDVNALLEEITNLRQELLDSQKLINETIKNG